MDVRDTVESLRVRKKDIIRYFEEKGISDANIARYSSSVGFPLVAIYVFLREEYPDRKEHCTKKLKDLCTFYGYEEL